MRSGRESASRWHEAIILEGKATTLSFFFKVTATTEIYTLSLHDALPILGQLGKRQHPRPEPKLAAPHTGRQRGHGHPHHEVTAGARNLTGTEGTAPVLTARQPDHRSEEHTSELQSHVNLVCRLLLEKKKT